MENSDRKRKTESRKSSPPPKGGGKKRRLRAYTWTSRGLGRSPNSTHSFVQTPDDKINPHKKLTALRVRQGFARATRALPTAC